MIGMSGYRVLDPVVVDVTYPGESSSFQSTKYDPPVPEGADDLTVLAWSAGVVAHDLGYPIAVIVEEDEAGDGYIYGFQFHWTSKDGQEWQHSAEPQFSLQQAQQWLEAVSFTGLFLRDRRADR
jgi:hypothetical protein